MYHAARLHPPKDPWLVNVDRPAHRQKKRGPLQTKPNLQSRALDFGWRRANAVTTLVHIGLGSIDSRMIMDPNMKVTTFTNANIGVSIKVITANTIGDFDIFISSSLFQKSLASQTS